MASRRSAKLILEFVRLAGPWRQRQKVAAALDVLLPALMARQATLPPGRYGITVALTNDTHQRELNHQFRGIARSTNVLSFPLYRKHALKKLPEQRAAHHLGDISLAYQYIAAEAVRDGKNLTNHIIHLVIHGVLHILGHDHQTARQAALMEQLERDVLAIMTIADPYQMPARETARRRPRRNPSAA